MKKPSRRKSTIAAWAGPEGRNETERRFLTRLHARTTPLYIDVWVDRPQLVTSVDVSDRAHPSVLRTLRVDFDGAHLWGGEDPTKQLVGELDPTRPDSFERSDAALPEAYAEIAASFFLDQLKRPIDREEWKVGKTVLCRWTLADVGRGLVSTLGIPKRPPDRVIRVRPDRQ